MFCIKQNGLLNAITKTCSNGLIFINQLHSLNDVTGALQSDCAPKIRRAQNDFGEAFFQTLRSRSGDVIHPQLRKVGSGYETRVHELSHITMSERTVPN